MKPKVEFLKEIKPLAESLTDVNKRVKYLDENVRKFEKVTVEVAKDVKKALSVTDKIKAGLFKQVNPRLASAVNMATSLISLGLTVLTIKANEEIQGYQITVDGLREAETQRNFDLTLKQAAKLKALQAQYNVDIPRLKTGLDQTRGDVAGVMGNLPKVRETANEALYEARAGRGILETKIVSVDKKANNALYETRQGRQILDKKVDTVDKKIDKIDTKVTNLDKDFGGLIDFSNKNAQDTYQSFLRLQRINEIDQQNTNLINEKTDANTKRIDKIETTVVNLPFQVKAIVTENSGEIITRTSDVIVKIIQPQINDLKNNQSTLQKNIDNIAANSTKQFQSIVGQQNNASKQLNDQYNQYIKDSQSLFDKKTTITFDTYKKDLDSNSNLATKRLDDLTKQLNDLSKVGENQRRMDQEANDKLAAIIPLLVGIPLLTAAAIRPSIPTIPQIESAAATGTCRTLQPGGCSRRALDDLGNGINQNTNNAGNNLLNRLNAGANAAQLALLNTVNNKLGPLIPGTGIGGLLQKFFDNFEKFAKWTHLDRILNILTFATTVHNAFQLSSAIEQTLVNVLQNALSLIGISDKDGNPLNINEFFKQSFEESLKTFVGEGNYKKISQEWAKYNRIYQAAANLLNIVQSLQYTIINILEVGFSWVAQIGNALRYWGEIGQNAYSWMNPQPNFQSKVFDYLNEIQAAASVVDQITTDVVSVKDQLKQFKEGEESLKKSLGQENDSKQGEKPPEAAEVKKLVEKGKKASAPPNLVDLDKISFDD